MTGGRRRAAAVPRAISGRGEQRPGGQVRKYEYFSQLSYSIIVFNTVKSPRTEIFDQLREIQGRYGYLPADQLRELSGETGTPLFRIHGVADFYPHFQLKPPPKVCINVCSDMACHINGADALRDGLADRFRGMSSSDVTVGRVSCLGQCDGAPAVSINDHVYQIGRAHV